MAKMIYRTLEIMPFGTNCYLVASEQTRDGMVVDPAGDAPRILSNTRELDLNIGLIVVTHTSFRDSRLMNNLRGLYRGGILKHGVSSDYCPVDTLPSLASVIVRVQIH